MLVHAITFIAKLHVVLCPRDDFPLSPTLPLLPQA